MIVRFKAGGEGFGILGQEASAFFAVAGGRLGRDAKVLIHIEGHAFVGGNILLGQIIIVFVVGIKICQFPLVNLDF